MAKGYFIRKGDKTSCGGEVLDGDTRITVFGFAHARAGDPVSCGKDNKTYEIEGGVSFMDSHGRLVAGSLDSASSCPCKATLEPSIFITSYISKVASAPPAARAVPQPATAPAPGHPVTARRSGSAATAKTATPTFSERPGTACENLWRGYQQRVENVVAPGGQLITDPKARNKAINAAYAQLWRHDPRFQWAGLAAFASKQVGCGLLHAAESIDKMQAEKEAMQQLRDSARQGLVGLLSPSEREKRATIKEYEQRQRDYEQANRDNPVWGFTHWGVDSALPLAQRMYRFVHEMLAMGNTTLFLDVYPLHVFYAERGLEALKVCLESRKNIYGTGEHPVLWPVGQETLKFGTEHDEILQAFEAIETDNIAESVEHLAWHEQKNILQPAMYSDWRLNSLLLGNHFSYVIGIPSGAAEAVELTLASQCRRIDDGRTIGFGNNPVADLSDIRQRMPFVLRAAAQFDKLLKGSNRHQMEQAIKDIAAGLGVR
ncbi:PAAR domain-containing protein [Pseudomonas sp. PDM26]|uniref:PAAR domain-containing protein n=1 Tax=Pseudomonas sp. PDM26 TaxID=2854766 RepID=UPI001C476E32|nr:PAAR domain-containing protein [Pseudomonas sp. PDM26]MBV7546230.1 PAAR domain-containing protein [Pseudomonas sp. PDM26]